MSIYTMSQKDVLRVGLLSKYVERPEVVTQIELTDMALPVTLFVDTYTTTPYSGGNLHKRVNVRYAITLSSADTAPMPIVYQSIQSWAEVSAVDGCLVSVCDMLDIVKTIEKRVSGWDNYCVNSGLIPEDTMSTIWETWREEDWVERSTYDCETVHVSGEIKENAIFPEMRTDDKQPITRRQMTWAIYHLIEQGLLPQNTFELPLEDWDTGMADKVIQVCLFGEVVMD
jgi:hypothetical protein